MQNYIITKTNKMQNRYLKISAILLVGGIVNTSKSEVSNDILATEPIIQSIGRNVFDITSSTPSNMVLKSNPKMTICYVHLLGNPFEYDDYFLLENNKELVYVHEKSITYAGNCRNIKFYYTTV